MAEYIEREEIIAYIDRLLGKRAGDSDSVAYFAFERFRELLKLAPAADAVEVQHGEWQHFTELEVKQTSGKITIPKKYLHGQCSNCNHCFIMLNKNHFLYCPNCGTKMDGKGDNNG